MLVRRHKYNVHYANNQIFVKTLTQLNNIIKSKIKVSVCVDRSSRITQIDTIMPYGNCTGLKFLSTL